MPEKGYEKGFKTNTARTFKKPNTEALAGLNSDNPIIQLFARISVQLTERQDRHERLVKLSRDITIESKRIIFLLHSAYTKQDVAKVVEEAEVRLNKLIAGPIQTIAIELQNSPNYLHHRAITPGLQEFIEAYTFWFILKDENLPMWGSVQKEFQFTIPATEEIKEHKVKTLLPPEDFILGIADLTGELMRRTINSLSIGDVETCNKSCQIVRDLYTGFLGLCSCGHQVPKKMKAMRQSVSKVEAAVYALHVRGGEIPPSLLASTASPPNDGIEIEMQRDYDIDLF